MWHSVGFENRGIAISKQEHGKPRRSLFLTRFLDILGSMGRNSIDISDYIGSKFIPRSLQARIAVE